MLTNILLVLLLAAVVLFDYKSSQNTRIQANTKAVINLARGIRIEVIAFLAFMAYAIFTNGRALYKVSQLGAEEALKQGFEASYSSFTLALGFCLALLVAKVAYYNPKRIVITDKLFKFSLGTIPLEAITLFTINQRGRLVVQFGGVRAIEFRLKDQEDYQTVLRCAEELNVGNHAEFVKQHRVAQLASNLRGAIPLAGVVKNYDWGGNSYLSKHVHIDQDGTFKVAELWFGTHKDGQGVLTVDGTALRKLADKFYKLHPNQSRFDVTKDFYHILLNFNLAYGQPVKKSDLVAREELPFLFKLLDVARPLSIQIHPDKETAVRGYANEDKLKIALSSPNRTFKDQNHKPELVVAQSDFWLLHGFKHTQDILAGLTAPVWAPFKQFLEAEFAAVQDLEAQVEKNRQALQQKREQALSQAKDLVQKRTAELEKARSKYQAATDSHEQVPTSNQATPDTLEVKFGAKTKPSSLQQKTPAQELELAKYRLERARLHLNKAQAALDERFDAQKHAESLRLRQAYSAVMESTDEQFARLFAEPIKAAVDKYRDLVLTQLMLDDINCAAGGVNLAPTKSNPEPNKGQDLQLAQRAQEAAKDPDYWVAFTFLAQAAEDTYAAEASVIYDELVQNQIQAEKDAKLKQAIKEELDDLDNLEQQAEVKARKRFSYRTISQSEYYVEDYVEIDRGLASFYLFNLFKLEAGQGLFQGANVPHAYLRGRCYEVMAQSDNVIRGGLTKKYINRKLLLELVDTNPVEPNVQSGPAYQVPVDDFTAQTLDVDGELKHYVENATIAHFYSVGPQANSNLELVFYDQEGKRTTATAKSGETYFLTADQHVTFSGKAQVILASC